jgi:hypothetical protein
MEWVKLNTDYQHHPKVIAAGARAELLYVRLLAYAAYRETDGVIPAGVPDVLFGVDPFGDAGSPGEPTVADLMDRLVKVGLLDKTYRTGWVIHDYLEHQQSKQELAELRSKRQAAGRQGGKQKASNALASAKQTATKDVADRETDRDVDVELPKDRRQTYNGDARGGSSSSSPFTDRVVLLASRAIAESLNKGPRYAAGVARNWADEPEWQARLVAAIAAHDEPIDAAIAFIGEDYAAFVRYVAELIERENHDTGRT